MQGVCAPLRTGFLDTGIRRYDGVGGGGGVRRWARAFWIPASAGMTEWAGGCAPLDAGFLDTGIRRYDGVGGGGCAPLGAGFLDTGIRRYDGVGGAPFDRSRAGGGCAPLGAGFLDTGIRRYDGVGGGGCAVKVRGPSAGQAPSAVTLSAVCGIYKPKAVYSLTTGLRSVPMPGISTSTTSPA